MGEFPKLGATHGPNLNFRRAVSAEDSPIVNECDLEAVSGGGEGSADARITASYNDEIVVTLDRGNGGEAELLAAKIEEGLPVIGRSLFGILGEVEGVATTVEAGEIVKFEGGFRCRDLDCASILPVPLGTLGSEGGGGGVFVDADFEFPRRAGSIPFSDPIFGADVEMVGAG